MSAVDTEREQQVLEELDFPTKCTLFTQELFVLGPFVVPMTRVVGCDRPATYRLVCNACSAVAVVCPEHRTHILTTTVICTGCATEGPGSVIYRFEPLDGAS